MKKRLLSVVLAVVMAVCLVGCGTTYQGAAGNVENNELDDFAGGYFIIVTEWGRYKIVCAKDTKVKYLIGFDGYRFGITPLYNADGTLQIYEESED